MKLYDTSEAKAYEFIRGVRAMVRKRQSLRYDSKGKIHVLDYIDWLDVRKEHMARYAEKPEKAEQSLFRRINNGGRLYENI